MASPLFETLTGIVMTVSLSFSGYAQWVADPGGRTANQANPYFLARADSYRTAAQATPVTVVEFVDFQCPYSAQSAKHTDQALKEYPGQVNYVLRHYPLESLHRHALLAAQAAEAAHDQGKLWEMRALLFKHQREWGNSIQPLPYFVSYAQQLGLDVERFKTDLSTEKFLVKVKRDQHDGTMVGVMGTPTFFINQRYTYNMAEYSLFQDRLEAELNVEPV